MCQNVTECVWLQLNNGVRICAASSIPISGAIPINECTPIVSEFLPATARNQRGFVIRQSAAPNNNFQLAITFPVVLYYDAAPSSTTVNYTCEVVSGAEGWTLQTTTTQSVISTTAKPALEVYRSILKRNDKEYSYLMLEPLPLARDL